MIEELNVSWNEIMRKLAWQWLLFCAVLRVNHLITMVWEAPSVFLWMKYSSHLHLAPVISSSAKWHDTCKSERIKRSRFCVSQHENTADWFLMLRWFVWSFRASAVLWWTSMNPALDANPTEATGDRKQKQEKRLVSQHVISPEQEISL